MEQERFYENDREKMVLSIIEGILYLICFFLESHGIHDGRCEFEFNDTSIIFTTCVAICFISAVCFGIYMISINDEFIIKRTIFGTKKIEINEALEFSCGGKKMNKITITNGEKTIVVRSKQHKELIAVLEGLNARRVEMINKK